MGFVASVVAALDAQVHSGGVLRVGGHSPYLASPAIDANAGALNDRDAGSPDRSSETLVRGGAMFDPLSEVLRSVRLTGGLFLDVRLTAPWCVISELTVQDCRAFLADPAQLIFYHVVLKGGFLLFVEGEPPLEACAGDIVLLPRNDAHMLAT